MNTAVATSISLKRRAYRILPQYSSAELKPWWPVVQVVFVIVGVSLSLYVGVLLALGGSQAASYVVLPIGVLVGLVLWLMPDVARPKEPPFHKLFIAYLVLVVAWPSYVAVALPGFPWITPARMALGALALLAMVHFSQNAQLRAQVRATLCHDKWVMRAFIGYYAVSFVVAAIGITPGESLGYVASLLILNGLCMVIAAALFRQEQAIWAVALAISLGLIAAMLIAVVENAMQIPPWLNHIPNFMRIDEHYLELYTSPQSRVGDGRYRVRSTFPLVLYFGLYLNLAMPLLFYMMAKMRGKKLILAVALVPLIAHAAWAANARTAVLAVAFTLVGYAGLFIARQLFMERRADVMKGGLMVVGILAALAMAVALVASSHRAQVFTLGGAQHADSNAGRDMQWENTWGYLKGNVIGAGASNAADLVGVAQGSVLAVDSYWIILLVDTGVLGFIFYAAIWLRLLWLGIMTFMRARTPLENLSAAFTLAVLNYVVTSYVVATDMVNYLPYIHGAAILSLHRLQTQRLAREAQAAPAAEGGGYGMLVPVR